VKLKDQFDLEVTLSELIGLGINHCVLFFKCKLSTIRYLVWERNFAFPLASLWNFTKLLSWE